MCLLCSVLLAWPEQNVRASCGHTAMLQLGHLPRVTVHSSGLRTRPTGTAQELPRYSTEKHRLQSRHRFPLQAAQTADLRRGELPHRCPHPHGSRVQTLAFPTCCVPRQRGGIKDSLSRVLDTAEQGWGKTLLLHTRCISQEGFPTTHYGFGSGFCFCSVLSLLFCSICPL